MYPIPPEVYKYLKANPGASGADLSRIFGIPGRSARRYRRKFEAGEAVPKTFSVGSAIYYGAAPLQPPPRFTGQWNLEGDFLILNDIHIPATNWEFADKAIQVGVKHLSAPRKVIIVGDLINADALSRWDDVVVVTPLADEIEYANAFLNHLSQYFDEIYLTRGNHEDRLLKSLSGQLHVPAFKRMVSAQDKVQFSMYSYLTVTSGGIRWRLTHQKNYSKNPLIVARQLALKEGTNIICAHQHHSAVGRSFCNRYTCIDSGGLHNPELMSYVMLDDNTSPKMNNGFVLLKEGVSTLFTPYPEMTDWGVWL